MSLEQAEQIRHKYAVKYWDWFGLPGTVGGDAIYSSLPFEERTQIDEAERLLASGSSAPTKIAA